MSERRRVVVVGASLAGGAAATTLREEGFDGPITMVGAEPVLPYERPPLSKEYLRGQEPSERMLLHDEAWYADHDVEMRLATRAVRLDTGDRFVELEGGDRLPYDLALLATGGRNRRLDVPGRDLEGVHELRTIADADAIRADAARGGRVAIVGAGFIGSEVAASLRALGIEVEVVEFFDVPMVRVFGPEIGRAYEAIHRDHGVRFHLGEAVERFEGSGRVESVVTNRGTRIPCDFAVVGVGIQPAVEVVEGSDVEIDNGIVVDERCLTAAEGVFAAGDVANHLHPLFGRRLRVEHYDNALKQGAAAARNMLGADQVFDDPHWFWSDQYEHNLQYVGHAARWDDLVIRGSLEERSFLAFYLNGGLVEGVVGLDRGKEVRRSAALIRARRPVDPDLLRDEEVDLRRLGRDLAGSAEHRGVGR